MAPARRTAPAARAATFPLIVIGASAGGVGAVSALLAQLPQDMHAAILIVYHLAADASTAAMIAAIHARSAWQCEEAIDGQAIRAGLAYLAPPDKHMMIADGQILLTKGARENRARPAIDPLFRSAAIEYGNRVIGVILSGYLDDGTAGLIAIHRCGGVCVVQDPDDAAYPDMPRHALNMAQVDHCLPVAHMGALLATLAARALQKNPPVPDDLRVEAKIAERVLSDLESVEALGTQVPFNCPGCGGVLWQMGKGKQLRYRCHTGHAYTADVLASEQAAKMEETLWIALRMFEENRNLLIKMGKEGQASPSYRERVEQSAIHIGRLRAMLKADIPLVPKPADTS